MAQVVSPPDLLARRLALVGVAGYLYFLLLRPSQEGLALSLGLALGSVVLVYKEGPFVLPFFAGLFLFILLLHLFQGYPLFYLLGGALGLGLPYLVYRLRKPAR